MLIYFLQCSSYCRSASATFAAVPFFIPPPAHTGRPPDWLWCRLHCFLPPANPPTLRTLSKMVKKLWWSSLWSPSTFWIAPSSSLVKQFDRSAGRLPESGRSLWRVEWTVSTDTSWAWASFMTLSRQSFSTSAVILEMDTVAVKFLWSAAKAARSHILPFDNHL